MSGRGAAGELAEGSWSRGKELPERDVAVADSSERPTSVLVSVGFSEGALIAQALRELGIPVIEGAFDVFTTHPPQGPVGVLVLDVDPPRSLDGLERIRDLYATAEIVCIGDPGRAADLGITISGGRHFERPLDVNDVVRSVLRIAAAGGEGAQDVHFRSPYPRDRDTAPPRGGPGTFAPLADPSAGENLDPTAIFPPFDDLDSSVRLVPPEPSPELTALLRAAEQRFLASGALEAAPARPPENDAVLLPAHLVAVLDDPLDPEDESSAVGPLTRAGTGNPLRLTSAEVGSRPMSAEPARPLPTPGPSAAPQTPVPPQAQATSPYPAPPDSVPHVQALAVASAALPPHGPASSLELLRRHRVVTAPRAARSARRGRSGLCARCGRSVAAGGSARGRRRG